jgi:acetyl esterase/lipase
MTPASFLSVTALMHGDRDPSIAAMVLDSPFSDLTRLCEEMVDKARDQGINVPGFVSSVAIRMIRGSVRRQAEFDIRDVSPISHAPHCFIPALFVAAENDDFITKSHSISLNDAYAGDSNMIVVDGKRERFCMDCLHCYFDRDFDPPYDDLLHALMKLAIDIAQVTTTLAGLDLCSIQYQSSFRRVCKYHPSGNSNSIRQ